VPTDSIVTEITAAIAILQSGDRGGARSRLQELCLRISNARLAEGGLCGGLAGRGPAAKERCRDQGDEEAYRQRFHKGVPNVDEGVLVELLGVPDSGDLRGGGSGVEAGGLHLVDLCGEVAVHEVGHEVEIENLPHDHVADGADEGDEDAASESAAEGDLAGEGVVPVAADTEVDEQERRHHDGVAENEAVAGADLVGDEQRAAHENRHDEAGDEAKGEDGLLHVRLLGVSKDRVTMQCGRAGRRHPFG